MIEQLRAMGLGMGSSYMPVQHEDENGAPVTTKRYVCWTTDEAKATAAQDLGATIRPYRSNDPRFNGWEISVSEVVGADQA